MDNKVFVETYVTGTIRETRIKLFTTDTMKLGLYDVVLVKYAGMNRTHERLYTLQE